MLNNSNVLANEVNAFSDLSTCFKNFFKYDTHEPNISIHPDFKEYLLKPYDEESLVAHEAGYDALITGFVFLKALGRLNLYSILNTNKFNERMDYFKNRVYIYMYK